MGICEMCGKESKISDAIVEGTVLSVCQDCATFGKVVPLSRPEPKIKMVQAVKQESIEDIKPEFANLIREAREKKELTQEKLAQAIAEKMSVIQNLETGNLKPSFNLAKKLEQFLHIQLIEVLETNENDVKKDFNLTDPSLTIGDLLNMKK